jgi:hypothetical protein
MGVDKIKITVYLSSVIITKEINQGPSYRPEYPRFYP